MTSNKPNLFQYATKELSQDAFLCWLLKWSEKKFETENPKLHAVATHVLADFIEVEPDSLEIEFIEIKQQFQNIDIVLYFNNYVVAIEDKVRAEMGKDQLINYATKLNKLAQGKKKKIGILLKSFVVRQDEIEICEKAEFKVYDLIKLKGVLSSVLDVNSDIFNDYLSHLDKVYRDIYGFDQKPIESWNVDNYLGLSLVLKKELGIEHNFGTFRKGDVFWFRIHTQEIPDLPALCLEMKDKELVLKSTVHNGEYHDLMKFIHERFVPNENKLKRKNKKSKHLTLYRLPQPLIKNDEGLIDLDRTINNIKSLIEVLKTIK